MTHTSFSANLIHVLIFLAASILLFLPISHAAPICPIQLISIDVSCVDNVGITDSENNADDVCRDSNRGEGRLVLHDDALDYISSLESPLYIVPALGVYRGGKSLLLNRAMNLTSPYLNGFGVGHSQSTFTRGINICHETVDNLGTIIWMDTEGLWSSEDAQSAHGPKLFSLALLLSSTVLLNQVKVLNDQFFDFFAEQQQVARILRSGLEAGGLPESEFLPMDLSLTWVLQQPIKFGDSDNDNNQTEDESNQLRGFFFGGAHDKEDTLRSRVAKEFNHSLHVIPRASHDARLWEKLDELPDSELLPEYVESTKKLRERVLEILYKTKGTRPATVVSHLKLFIDLVNTKSFAVSLAVEAFEEGEITQICEKFGTMLEHYAGKLPTNWLELRSATFHRARLEVESQVKSLVEQFHLDDAWNQRLERCLYEKEVNMTKANSNAVMKQWYEATNAASEHGSSCFFIGSLYELLGEYDEAYGEDFQEREQALSYAKRLQRTRLFECIRLGDLLFPLFAWLAWPFCSLFLQQRSGPGLTGLLSTVVMMALLYIMLKFTKSLPPYLCFDYPILKACPYVLDMVMVVPWPWETFGQTLSWVGIAFTLWRISQRVIYLYRAPGDTTGQMLNLELKLNKVIESSKGKARQYIVERAMDVSDCLDDGDVRKATRCLLRALYFIANSTGSDELQSELSIDNQLKIYIRNILSATSASRLPPKSLAIRTASGDKLVELVCQGTIRDLVVEMCIMYQKLFTLEQKHNPHQIKDSGALESATNGTPALVHAPSL